MNEPPLIMTPPNSPRRSILVTGAAGEIGHGLISLLRHDDVSIVAMDLRDVPEETRSMCDEVHLGDVCDKNFLEHVMTMHETNEIYHLAALLSSRAEHVPETAHDVNVQGTYHLLRLSARLSESWGQRVKFIFPSTIAVYGIGSVEEKMAAGALVEGEHLSPITMYGANKLYCESLGRYYGRYYRQVSKSRPECLVDFRCLRLPGVIAADTRPSGGTSDYVPEMLHAAAQGEPYACFVREDTIIPWMTMPECVDSLMKMSSIDSPPNSVYNIGSFAASAGEFAEAIRRHFPGAEITFEPDQGRQNLVDSWPADVDCSRAREDWGFAPKWGMEEALEHYIVPAIRKHYEAVSQETS
ncbi:MAG: NAD-dependent epimerase/dehydratase family protein [Phycisphaerales bacterium]|nr:NAD-dependent epimerase/dehydratase family protein [Phycisphaerales bacterium]